ncbi:hypothetical protein SAMN05444858_1251 [Micromonospora avicenniae]|uniref:Uncharacterized protein n=1 Tax=Micromonospora avicenniae TaxID=1198245 RepID=A0A1N7ELV7_9ACTN|nr:hypothetical protein SAMN05444858_1251 [Micromonospora avicenniae]
MALRFSDVITPAPPFRNMTRVLVPTMGPLH